MRIAPSVIERGFVCRGGARVTAFRRILGGPSSMQVATRTAMRISGTLMIWWEAKSWPHRDREIWYLVRAREPGGPQVSCGVAFTLTPDRMKDMEKVKILLDESEIPRQWYNLAADLPTPMLPPLGPDGKPVSPDMLAPVFPMNLIEQEVSTKRWIDIPSEILDILYRWRPAPLRRAV